MLKQYHTNRRVGSFEHIPEHDQRILFNKIDINRS
jgi:hypothetical protein